MMRRSNVVFGVVLSMWVAACSSDPGTDGRDDSFLEPGGKADSLASSTHNPAIIGAVLRVANRSSRSLLIDEVGLAEPAADGIIAARPIESLRALDAVDFVGPVAFERLAEYAIAHSFRFNPAGPNLKPDLTRLAASARVVHNASPLPVEIAAGCSTKANNANLLRFDLAVANTGPADIDYSDAACFSTRTDPFCAEANCATSPECCRQNTFECPEYVGPDGEPIFQFEYPGGYIRFATFAEFHLFKNGVDLDTATLPRVQKVTLADIEGEEAGEACPEPSPFGGKTQGLHAGCTYVLSSALPCAYVDISGLAAGQYTLEIRIDPLDLIEESNEQDNVVQVPITIPTAPPPGPTPTKQLFLVKDGPSSVAEATQYYASLSPGPFQIGVYTLNQFRAQFMAGPTVKAYYRNAYDLGFWRDMICTSKIDRDGGGCTVTNYAKHEDKANGAANLGTVAMRLDDRGRTQFFVFGPDGKLAPTAQLDSEGFKSVPRLCTPCHVGEYRGPQSDPDVGAVFREFEPSMLEQRPAIEPDRAQFEWHELNQVIKLANREVRSEEEGAPFGVNVAKLRMEELIGEIYPPGNTAGLPVDDPTRIPSSWKTGSASVKAIKSAMWRNTVSHYCTPCHRNSLFNFENYQLFKSLASPASGSTYLEALLTPSSADPNREEFPFMPQAKLQWERLHSDDAAVFALQGWLELEAE